MDSPTLQQTLNGSTLQARLLAGLATLAGIYFLCVHPYFDGIGSYLNWNWISCNTKNGMIHGRFVPFLVLAFVYIGWKTIAKQPVRPSLIGLVGIIIFLACYLIAIRAKQPRMILVGLPFLLVGVSQCLFGWKVTRYALFPSFFLWFAMPLPGVEQATTFLQIWVTKMCFFTGKVLGMDIAVRGNEIVSTTDSWNMDIAEGCSGIRSLMALVMIAAIYGYFTQKALWKKIVIFCSALPLAMLGNYGRIVTIMFLNEAGYGEFAVGAYHNWAGLLIFFPIALAGLFLLDRLLNPRKIKLRSRKKTLQSKAVAAEDTSA